MCGISGTIGFDRIEFVERMNRQMSHRGPDNAGIWHEDLVCLGNTRLSIIDKSSSGNQPMSNEDKTIYITFNGEIYNFQILRLDLEAKGHRFKSNTDTEVIVHLYEEHQEGCLEYLRGMFSFALWDKRKRKLFAARDRLGIKPFFYFCKSGKFIFASELKAISATEAIERAVNSKTVRDYFTFGSVQAPQTMIRDVLQLLPAHYLIFEDGHLRIQKYWEIDFTKAHKYPKTENEYIADIRALLEEAVKIRLVSDVPLGAFLSGGIDSSILVTLMQKHSTLPIKTFSIIFREKEYDEREHSGRVAKEIGTDHKKILLKEEDILRKIPKILDSMDQPSMNGFNTFVISKALKSAGLTVALSGLGGDELFAGYSLFRTLPKIIKLVKLTSSLPEIIKKGMYGGLNKYLHTKKISKFLFAVLKCANLKDLQSLQRMAFLPDEVDELLTDSPSLPSEKSHQDKSIELDPINLISYLELSTYLQNTLLQDTDRMSMANSLEVRVPFLDHLLVEKMFEIPGKIKVGNDYPKRLLVKSMKDLLPDHIYDRPKMGFVFPFESWLKGELKDYCGEKFSEQNLKKVVGLDPKKVYKIWTDFSNGSRRYNYSSILALLSFINWYEKNIG